MPAAKTRSSEANTNRKRLVSAARRHFLAHGFRGVSMDELARELGMSKKTLYVMFPNKIELVRAAIADKFSDMEATLAEITANCDTDFLGTMHEMLAALLRHAAEIQPPFVRDIQRSAPELFAQVEGRRAALIRVHFGKLFAAGRRAGMIRKDIPAKLAIAILLGAVQGILNPQGIANLRITPRAGISAVITIILEGLVVRARRGNR